LIESVSFREYGVAMDDNATPYAVPPHFRKVHRLNLVVIAVVCAASSVQSFLLTDIVLALRYTLFSIIIIVSSCAVYFFPLRRIAKAVLIVAIPVVTDMVSIYMYQNTINNHYAVVLVFAMAAMYLDKRVILWLCGFVNAGLIVLLAIGPERAYAGPGGWVFVFSKMIFLTNASALLMYTVSRWSRGILRRLMRSNASLVVTNRSLFASEEELTRINMRLKESEERFRAIFEEMNDGVMLIDRDGIVFASNRAWNDICGFDGNRAEGKKYWDVMVSLSPAGKNGEDGRAYLRTMFQKYLSDEGTHDPLESEIVRKDGSSRIILQNFFTIETTGRKMIGVLTGDLTEMRDHERRIFDLAFLDPVTGLSNRTRFLEELRTRLSSENPQGAIFIINIDRLKVINDIFGHQFGDRLLVEVALIIKDNAPDAFISRLSGGEFALVSEKTAQYDKASARASELLHAFGRPFEVEGHKIHLAANIGIALIPDAGKSVAEVMKNADAALNKARGIGRNCYIVYDRAIIEDFAEYVSVESGLHAALGSGEFRLYYQPQIECATGKICGFEALIRWERDGGVILPSKFIRIAEETGLIVPIGLWVINEACCFAEKLRGNGHIDVPISVNISTLQLMQSDFIDRVNTIIDSFGINRSCIGFEITETAFMQSFETNVDKLGMLKRSGISIHLDDFGTGYSSLSYLKRLPIDVVKIDKSFIDDVVGGREKKDLTVPIVHLAHTIGLKVVAEGVESGEQLDELRRCECDMAQGFFVSKPIPSEKVFAFITEYSSSVV
jgi:diguanylate cyclase (GGDEF)-like protein/PAS domain S-box-containing protein